MSTRSRGFLALGDSYTIGEGVDAALSWPAQLVAALAAHGVQVAEMKLIARTGWTTDELDRAIDVARPEGPFDLVSLLVGVNNQYRGRPVDEYGTEFSALLARAVKFAGGSASHVVVVSIPDWGVTPFAEGRDGAAIARAIDAFNAAARDAAAKTGARWVDVTGISRERHDGWTADDGLHPSAAQYARWVEAILPPALALLR